MPLFQRVPRFPPRPRRPPEHPLPQGMVRLHLSMGESANISLEQWAYQTPSYPAGLPTVGLIRATPTVQQETMRCWFLANYEPMLETEGDQDTSVSQTWTAERIILDEFSDIVADHVRGLVAREFDTQSTKWCVIPDLVPPVTVDLSDATIIDLPAITRELLERLERLERLQRESDEARRGIGGNQGPPLIDFSVTIAEAKQALGKDNPSGVTQASAALSTFKGLLPEIGKGAAQEVGKSAVQAARPYVAILAVWLFSEVCHIILQLERWIDLMQVVRR